MREITSVTIPPVAGQSPTVTLATQPTAGNYCTAPVTPYTDGTRTWDVDQRTEVGMLSHNVRIVGVTSDQAGFGAHVMIMACCPYMPPGFGRFSNVELTRVGQRGRLGRYPMHWHMQRENGAGQYIRDCSIHGAFNRAITIHGSHNVHVERNVCFDVTGHAVFLEDGVERNNHFERNLVIFARRPTRCQQVLFHDLSRDQPQNRSPASFWISNPDNVFIDNVAADSYGTGYWFALHYQATGLSAQPQWSSFFNGHATTEDLGQFTGNVCHSCKMGIDVNDTVGDNLGLESCGIPGGTETPTDPTDDDIAGNILWLPTATAHLREFVSYGCTTGIYAGGEGFTEQLQFEECVLVDNGVHIQVASSVTVRDSLLVRDTGHGVTPYLDPQVYPEFALGYAYVAYDGPGRLYDSHLVGYVGATGTSVFYSKFAAAFRHTNHLVSGLTFAGMTPTVLPTIVFFDWSVPQPAPFDNAGAWGLAIRDLDGCLGGGAGNTLVTNHPMMALTTDSAANGAYGRWSGARWGHLRVRQYKSASPPLFYGVLEGALAPPIQFERGSFGANPPVAYLDNTSGGPHRQIPVIIRAAGSSATECRYTLELRVSLVAPPISRADFIVDDVDAGETTRLLIKRDVAGPWAPSVYVNELGSNDGNWTAVPELPSLPATTIRTRFARVPSNVVTPSTIDAIDIRFVNPARKHRITLTW